jgi:YVTN family beta-propeller protein
MRAIKLGGLICLSLVLASAPGPAPAETVLVYVTNSAGDNVHVVDPATNKVVQVIEGVEAPHGVDFSTDGKRVYLSNEADSTLDVVDRETGKVVKKVPLSGHPNNIAVSKDRIFVCIAEDKGGVDVVDAASLTLAKTIPTAGRMHNVYVTPDGKHAVAGSVRKKFMIAIDVATEQVGWQLDFDHGVRPMTIEAAPDGSTGRIFVQLSQGSGADQASRSADRLRAGGGTRGDAFAWHGRRARRQQPVGHQRVRQCGLRLRLARTDPRRSCAAA